MQALEHFRANVRDALKAFDFTQDDLAVQAQLSRPYINRVLAGKQEPSLPTCDSIADALGIPLAKMLDEPDAFQRFLKKVKTTVAMK